MPPRSRSTSTRKAAEVDEEVTDAPVTDLASVRVDIDLDAEAQRIDELDPFVFTLGGHQYEVPPPGVAETLDAEQAPYLEDFFRIVMGSELWREVEPVLREQEKPALLWKLGRAMSRAFKMDAASIQDAAEHDERNRDDRRGGRARPRRSGPRRSR